MISFIQKHKGVVIGIVAAAALYAAAASYGIFQKTRTVQVQNEPWIESAEERGKLIERIRTGKSMMKRSPPLEYVTSTGTDDGALIKKQIAFAILNTNTGELFEKRVWVQESDIRNAAGADYVPLTPVDPSDGLRVRVWWWNSYNTVYSINNHSEMVVVANKYLVERTRLPEQLILLLDDSAPHGKYFNLTYAPYSQLLHVPELIAEGRNYINDSVNNAYRELRGDKVHSLADPSRLVTDVVPQELIKTVILVEHVDPTSFLFADDGGKKLAERVLVLIGANEEWTFRYTGSPAGANGMAQFIESTYNSMLKTYPKGGLIKNYKLGMADHINALKAMVLFFDLHKRDLESKIKNTSAMKNGATEEMLAAAYNGGPGRVVRAVNTLGTKWATSSIFPGETSYYIKKYTKIRALNLFVK